MEDLQAWLDRVHVAQQEAEEEEEVLQQLKLACILPEDQQSETTALHHLSGLLVKHEAAPQNSPVVQKLSNVWVEQMS